MKVNLNHEYALSINDLPCGAKSIEVKIGRTTYIVDVTKYKQYAAIDFYEKKSNDRNRYSKYDVPSVLNVFVKPDTYLTRDFFEHIRDIKFAQNVFIKYGKIMA